MRYKMLALVLTLTVVSWAQTATQNAPSTPQQSTHPVEKAKCSCCDKTAAADAKETLACCAHHDMSAKEIKAGSCCAGKNASAKRAMSCMRNGKHENASCCKDSCSNEGCGKDSSTKDKTASARCDGKDRKSCCSGKKAEKTAKSCCKEELHS